MCPLGTVSVQMPRATAGPQGASTRMPVVTTAPARPGSSPARLSPARLPPTVPGAAGQPGVPAATRVGQEDCRAAFGRGPGETRRPLSCSGLPLPGPLSSMPFLGPVLSPCPGHPGLSLVSSCPLGVSPGVWSQDPEGKRRAGAASHLLPPGPCQVVHIRLLGPGVSRGAVPEPALPSASVPTPVPARGPSPHPGGQLATGRVPAVVSSRQGRVTLLSCWGAEP